MHYKCDTADTAQRRYRIVLCEIKYISYISCCGRCKSVRRRRIGRQKGREKKGRIVKYTHLNYRDRNNLNGSEIIMSTVYDDDKPIE